MYKITYLIALTIASHISAQTIETTEQWRSKGQEFRNQLDTKNP